MTQSKNDSYARVVLDSIGPNGKRLISVEMRYWRAIHAEFMTHRDRARNAASSRAIPFYKLGKCSACDGKGKVGRDRDSCLKCNGSGSGPPIDKCSYSFAKYDAFFPEFIGTEQKGMQSGGELVEPYRSQFLQLVEQGRDFMLDLCLKMVETGAHKSLVNRYMEPWLYITVITTATEWKNFARLRVHPKAEKHFQKVAGQCMDAIAASTPQILEAGQWHMPYLRDDDEELVSRGLIDGVKGMSFGIPIPKGFDKYDSHELVTTETLKRISAGRCARLSYLTHEGIRDHNKDIELFDTLIHPKFDVDRDDDVIHASPLEHVGQASDDPNLRSGPFVGWKQFRKEFPNENMPG